MGQSRTGRSRCNFAFFLNALLGVALAILPAGCDRPAPHPPTTAPTTKIASLVPAATGLLLAMHAGDRLVAVSNFDDQPEVSTLPRVGDYQQIDWEKLIALKPTSMVVQMRPDHMPPGLVQRAESQNIKLVNVQIEQVADIYTATEQLAAVAGDPAAGKALVDSLRNQLDAIRRQTAGKPRPRVLMVVDVEGKAVVGRGTFLSDLLDTAGGENVMPEGGPHWPTIDREMLASLKPDFILQLLPGASDQALAQAKTAWTTLPNLPAVKNGRVYPITDWFLHQPGPHIAETAKLFADRLIENK